MQLNITEEKKYVTEDTLHHHPLSPTAPLTMTQQKVRVSYGFNGIAHCCLEGALTQKKSSKKNDNRNLLWAICGTFFHKDLNKKSSPFSAI